MNQQAKPSIKTCQIIAGALMMGIVAFAVVSLVMHFSEEPVEDLPGVARGDEEMSIELLVTVVMACGVLLGRFITLRVQDKQAAEYLQQIDSDSVDSDELIGKYQIRMLLGMAALEGIAFLGLVMFISAREWATFGVSMVMLAWMAANFPTENKFRSWVRKLTGKSAYAGDE